MGLNKVSCLLNTPWEPCDRDESRIIGSWCEDNSLYDLKVPYQLRASIIYLQNSLYDKQEQIDKLEKELARLRAEVSFLP